ncbi:hypothetical protein ACFP1I_23370 [Dyadobacter subterraneus]|uniref:Muconolactone isomerase domain-containing protein n=1 Tax=Dyadobacter subterraneus TaxID=2773304 RepID=A0ABR9W8X4_9BACT|nr:hypothetical protein [Dyadobacter subterraneus]MBE9461932.1 hypothetical protein [Dyadobacter subterraneus]
MKLFIAVIAVKPEISHHELAGYAVEEREHFMDLVSKKKIDHYYEKTGVLKFWCIVYAPDMQQAETILHGLPFYQKGFLTIDIDEVEQKGNI